jgi:hypothetical protein
VIVNLVQVFVDEVAETDSFRSVLKHVAQGSHGSGIVAKRRADGITRPAVNHGDPDTRFVDSCEGDVLHLKARHVVADVVWLGTEECQQCFMFGHCKSCAYQGSEREGRGWRFLRSEWTWLLCLEVVVGD